MFSKVIVSIDAEAGGRSLRFEFQCPGPAEGGLSALGEYLGQRIDREIAAMFSLDASRADAASLRAELEKALVMLSRQAEPQPPVDAPEKAYTETDKSKRKPGRPRKAVS